VSLVLAAAGMGASGCEEEIPPPEVPRAPVVSEKWARLRVTATLSGNRLSIEFTGRHACELEGSSAPCSSSEPVQNARVRIRYGEVVHSFVGTDATGYAVWDVVESLYGEDLFVVDVDAPKQKRMTFTIPTARIGGEFEGQKVERRRQQDREQELKQQQERFVREAVERAEREQEREREELRQREEQERAEAEETERQEREKREQARVKARAQRSSQQAACGATCARACGAQKDCFSQCAARCRK